jgi:hypothetical protein
LTDVGQGILPREIGKTPKPKAGNFFTSWINPRVNDTAMMSYASLS